VRVLLRTAATLDSGGRGAVPVSVGADPGAKSADPVAVGAATSTAAATVLVRPLTRAQRRGLLRQASPSGFRSGSLGADPATWWPDPAARWGLLACARSAVAFWRVGGAVGGGGCGRFGAEVGCSCGSYGVDVRRRWLLRLPRVVRDAG